MLMTTNSYPCSHAVCKDCAKGWWQQQKQERQQAEYETWFKCPICRAATGDRDAPGVPVEALEHIVEIL